MSFAVIGTGRTGREVLNLLPEREATAFNSRFPPTLEALREHQAAIVFVPGQAMPDLLPLLLDWARPVVVGSTAWSSDTLDEDLRRRGLAWVQGANFSPAMALLQPLIRALGEPPTSWWDPIYELEETHHRHKRDQPSGTALAWRGWLDREVPIRSHREGEVVGRHGLRIGDAFEEIVLHHEVKDRAVFARGALAAAQTLLAHPEWRGLIPFEYLLAMNGNTELPHEPRIY